MRKQLNDKSAYIRFFTPLLVLLSVLIIYIILDIYNKNTNATKISNELNNNIYEIVYFDEILTMSSRMAVLTGDEKWIDRYNSFVPKLDTAIENSSNIVPEILNNLQVIDQANRALIAMELESFELLKDGKKDEAQSLLFSQNYASSKKIYTDGIKQSLDVIEEKRNKIADEIQQELLLSMMIISCLLMVNIYFAWVMLKYLKNYTTKLHKEVDIHVEKYKIAQEKLLEENNKAQIYLDLAGNMIVALDKRGDISLINKYGADLLESTESELLGSNWFDEFLVTEELKTVKSYFNELMQGNLEAVKYVDNKIKTSKGNILDMSWHNSLIYEDTQIVGVLSSGTNITKQKEYENTIIKAKELADAANSAKSSFLASMSHEIRTPMTGLLGFIERLKSTESDPQRIKQFNVIENSGQTLLSIINDILDFSKIESGKIELEASAYNLHKVFSSSIDIYSTLASTKNISLHSMIDENLPACLVGDETRLKQVIFNLLSNAIKFTNEQGRVTLNANYNTQKQMIYIAVVDTGVGIAKENIEKIFEAFAQEDVSTTRKFGGTGLGLSISQHLVKAMGSEIKVESVVGQGSKFSFEIPIK